MVVSGAFLTPQNQRPQDRLMLAEVCEDAGLDLVTFQDHAYQPAFLDTWTLLSYAAAKTERAGSRRQGTAGLVARDRG